MTVEDLRAAVIAVPGVAFAEVALRDDDAPVVRVWTDGSRGDLVVQNDVGDVIAIHGYGSGRMEANRAALEARIADTIGGLSPGRSTDAASRPMPLPADAPGLVKLVIEETGDTLVAIASDSSGRSARSHVGEGDDAFLRAVTDAVSELRGVTPTPALLSVEDRFVAGVDVISVLIENAVGERYAGAAVVRGGRPFTVGRAVDAALANSL